MNTIDIVILAIYVSVCLIGPLVGVALAVPSTVPWGARGRAARQINAIQGWKYLRLSKLDPLLAKAKGYFAVRDYLGVESAYLAARRIVDGEQP